MVVPARDEAAHIADCVAALCRSGRDVVEIVVVDDGSSDATAAEALSRADGRVRVISAPDLVPGRLGKPSACAAGAFGTTGEWVWFVDADVTVEPDLVARLLAAADESDADLVSAVGRLTTTDRLTGWLLPAVGFTVARRADPARIADAMSSTVFAVGHCLLVRRTAYDAVGGHLAVADQVVEDVALARLVKSRGGTVALATAFDGFTVQMYDDARSAWSGLLKNTSAVQRRPLVAELASAALCLAPLGLVWSRSPRTRAIARVALVAQLSADLAARLVARQPVLPSLAAPVVDSVLAGQHLQAAARRRRGGAVAWRGRDVPLG